MAEYVDVFYAPDFDPSWDVNPGLLTIIDGFAPLRNGSYASVGPLSLGTLTGPDINGAWIFRQTDGSCRLLVVNDDDIDEYSSVFARTNRSTGLVAANWSMAAWGNDIYAVSLANATRVSTGGGFSAAGGSTPRGKLIAANLNFVMMADVDDTSAYTHKDAVWWSALQNPSSWTPSIATQAGRQRLLDAPGQITALIAFGDSFVAFKDNAIFVGDYVGPQQFIFNWRMVSNRIGCVGKDAVVELGSRLYFLHTTGFYEFNGQSVTNIGLPVAQTFLKEAGYIDTYGSGGALGPASSDAISLVQAVADDIECVAWFKFGNTVAAARRDTMYGYNQVTKKWSRSKINIDTVTTDDRCVFLKASFSDVQSFLPDQRGRVWLVWNKTGATTLQSIKYPYGATSNVPSLSTGVFGASAIANRLYRVSLRHLRGSTAFGSSITGTVNGYTQEDLTFLAFSTTLASNSEFNALDGAMDSRYKIANVTYPADFVAVLGGLAIGSVQSGSR
jgi:hypothetical protein